MTSPCLRARLFSLVSYRLFIFLRTLMLTRSPRIRRYTMCNIYIYITLYVPTRVTHLTPYLFAAAHPSWSRSLTRGRRFSGRDGAMSTHSSAPSYPIRRHSTRGEHSSSTYYYYNNNRFVLFIAMVCAANTITIITVITIIIIVVIIMYTRGG